MLFYLQTHPTGFVSLEDPNTNTNDNRKQLGLPMYVTRHYSNHLTKTHFVTIIIINFTLYMWLQKLRGIK